MNEPKKRGPKLGTVRRPWTPEVRRCVVCDTAFEAGRAYQRKTCSDVCKYKLLNRCLHARIQEKQALKANQPPKPKRQRCLHTPVVRPCTVCGKMFENWTTKRKQTCSWECRSELLRRMANRQFQLVREGKPHQPPERIPPPNLICAVCGKTFVYDNKWLNIRSTCSKTCTRKLQSKQRRVNLNNTCMMCGQTFVVNPRTRKRKMCSRKCLRKFMLHRLKNIDRSHLIVWRSLTCVVCGKTFQQTGKQFNSYSPKRTCSPECKLERQRQTGLMTQLSPEAYKIIGEKAAAHPKTGHFETNQHAKDYSLKSPDGEIFQFRNLALFIDRHQELIASTVGGMKYYKFTNARSGLSVLAPWRKDRQGSWHGWKWYDDGNTTSGDTLE